VSSGGPSLRPISPKPIARPSFGTSSRASTRTPVGVIAFNTAEAGRATCQRTLPTRSSIGSMTPTRRSRTGPNGSSTGMSILSGGPGRHLYVARTSSPARRSVKRNGDVEQKTCTASVGAADPASAPAAAAASSALVPRRWPFRRGSMPCQADDARSPLPTPLS
jgi:hypothetical protein